MQLVVCLALVSWASASTSSPPPKQGSVTASQPTILWNRPSGEMEPCRRMRPLGGRFPMERTETSPLPQTALCNRLLETRLPSLSTGASTPSAAGAGSDSHPARPSSTRPRSRVQRLWAVRRASAVRARPRPVVGPACSSTPSRPWRARSSFVVPRALGRARSFSRTRPIGGVLGCGGTLRWSRASRALLLDWCVPCLL